MGDVHQVLVFVETLLEAFALFVLQQIEVDGGVQERLDQTLPRFQCRDVGSNRSADPCPDHQDEFLGLLSFEAWQELPARPSFGSPDTKNLVKKRGFLFLKATPRRWSFAVPVCKKRQVNPFFKVFAVINRFKFGTATFARKESVPICANELV